ncbi:MAG: bacteriohemerythrin [Methanomassiliicoccus sp.]|nr:bacteriohemerythrin [Methanomassiliicoccus sp.]
MSLMEWSQDYSVNVKEIDEQHKNLIRMINELHDAMVKGQGRSMVGKILSDMTEYAKKHFATEERYMKKFNYPGYNAHHLEHERFVEKVSTFKDDFDAHRLDLTIDVMNFLFDWLKNHILTVDKKFGPFFNYNGLT